MMCHVGGVVAGGGVPADGDGLAGELERDGPLDRAGGAVARLPGPEDLLAVFYRDLNRPPVMPLKPRGSLACGLCPGR